MRTLASLLTLLLIAAPLQARAAGETYVWRDVPRGDSWPSLGRVDHSMITLNATHFITFEGEWLGVITKEYAEALPWVFDTTTLKWSQMPAYGDVPFQRLGHIMCMIDAHRLVMVAGYSDLYDSAGGYYMDVHVLDTRTWVWTDMSDTIAANSADVPLPRAWHRLLLMDYSSKGHASEVVMWGGCCVPSSNALGLNYDDGWVLDVEEWKWTLIDVVGDKPAPRDGHAFWAMGPLVFVAAGWGTNTTLSTDIFPGDLWMLDTSKPRLHWELLSVDAVLPKSYFGFAAQQLPSTHNGQVLNTRVWMIGGSYRNPVTEAWNFTAYVSYLDVNVTLPQIPGGFPEIGFNYVLPPVTGVSMLYARWSHGTVYSPATQSFFVFAGDNPYFSNDQVTFDDVYQLSSGCVPGYFLELIAGSGQGVCTACPAGQISALPGAVSCTNCPPGTYAASAGSSVCTSCARSFYAPSIASSSCLACPALSQTKSLASTSVLQCTCVKGAYLLNGTCTKCPDGGQCEGGYAQPEPAAGFWQIPGENTFLKCFPANACPGGDNSSCISGHAGKQCAFCADGYFKSTDDCAKCSGLQKFKLAILFILVIVGFAVIGYLAVAVVEDLKATPTIIVFFLQVQGILSEIRLGWAETSDSSSSSVMNSGRLANLQLNSFEIDCNNFPYTFWDQNAGIIIAPFAALLAYYLCIVAFHRYSIKAAAKEGKPRPDFPTDFWLRLFINIVLLVFMPAINQTLGFFMCQLQADGTYLLVLAPPNLCYTSEWYASLPLVIISTFVWIVAVPVYFGWILYKNRDESKLKDKAFMARYGALYVKYRPSHFYFLIIELGIKALLMITLVVWANDVLYQATGAFLVLLAFLFLLCALKPFRRMEVNYLAIAAQACLLIVVALGISLLSDSISLSGKIGVNNLITSIISICLFALAVGLVKESKQDIIEMLIMIKLIKPAVPEKKPGEEGAPKADDKTLPAAATVDGTAATADKPAAATTDKPADKPTEGDRGSGDKPKDSASVEVGVAKSDAKPSVDDRKPAAAVV